MLYVKTREKYDSRIAAKEGNVMAKVIHNSDRQKIGEAIVARAVNRQKNKMTKKKWWILESIMKNL